MNYYNENNAEAAAWLRALIAAGEIPAGTVDERSITEIEADELTEYTQCHFFAGIGGWSLALKLARWAETEPVWTGSCPCQPLSCAGSMLGHADERHLWPSFYSLIAKCGPATIFGEQVASPLGREWLAGIRADMEGIGYAVGAADLCAAGVSAPFIGQRLHWVATAKRGRWQSGANHGKGTVLARTDGDALHAWRDFCAIEDADGNIRRIGPGIVPLVDGFPGRVECLRGYGNAIVPQLAAAFIEASQFR